MASEGLPFSHIAWNALVSSCRPVWRTACLLSTQPRQVRCNAACSACEKATAWRCAAQLVQSMAPQGLEADVVSYDVLVSSAPGWRRAMGYVSDLMKTRACLKMVKVC